MAEYQALVQMLQSQDTRTRRHALAELTQYDDPRVIDLLFAAFDDPDLDIRHTAASMLYPQYAIPALPRLIMLLSDQTRSSAVRAAAAYGLHEYDHADAHTALRTSLSDPAPEVRESAVWALGMLRDRIAITSLIDLLATDGSAGVRAAAALALSRLGDVLAVPALIDRLGDSDAFVRSQVAECLAAFDDLRVVEPLMAALNDPQIEVVTSAAWALAQLGDERAVKALGERVRRLKHDVGTLERLLGELVTNLPTSR